MQKLRSRNGLIESANIWFCPLGCGSVPATETANHSDICFAETYNSAVDAVLSDADLLDAFNAILDERKAILTIDGLLSEAEAEAVVTEPNSLRAAVCSVRGL